GNAVGVAANPAARHKPEPDVRRINSQSEKAQRARCLLNDSELRRLYLERFELTGPALRILCRDGVPHDAGRRIVGDDPLGDPELALRLRLALAIAHGHV